MEKRIHFLDQLIYAKKNGISVDVEGVSFARRRAEDVIKIMQRDSYMVDYESDDTGRITAIHVNHVCRSV